MTEPPISGAAQVAALLGRIIHARCLLTLRLGSSAQACTSLLLGVDARRRWLFLDAPHPALPGALLHRGALLAISGRLDGGHFEFHCAVDACVLRETHPTVRAGLPASIHYDERRAHFRLPIPASFATEPLVLSGASSSCRGYLVDMSDSGAGALLQPADGASVGGVMRCQLRLPELTLLTDAEVRSLALDRRGGRVGLRFGALTAEQRHRLAGALSHLQRRMIRGALSRM